MYNSDDKYQLMSEEAVISEGEYMGINYVMTNRPTAPRHTRPGSLGDSNNSWIFFHFQLDRVMRKREKKICYCNTWFQQIRLENGKVEYIVGLCSTDLTRLLDIQKGLFEKIHETNANINATPNISQG